MTGLYPRSEDLVRAMRKVSRSKLSRDEFMRLASMESGKIIRLQRDSGLSRIMDGQLLWHDHFRPFAEKLEGVEVGPLARWYENNVFYKKPRIVADVRWTRPILNDYLFADNLTGLDGKLVLPDPFTMAVLSENRYYKREEELVLDIAEALAAEVSHLSGNSWLKMIQLTAPGLVAERLHGDRASVAMEAIRLIKNSFNGELLIHTFFYDLSRALPWILDAEVDVIGFDATVSRISEIESYDIDVPICIGIVDSRNSYVEGADEIVRQVKAIFNRLNPPEAHISPSSDLDFLPSDVAARKVREMGNAFRTMLRGEG